MQAEVREALVQLIRGTGVKRGSHELTLDSKDWTSEFLELVAAEGFRRAGRDLERSINLSVCP